MVEMAVNDEKNTFVFQHYKEPSKYIEQYRYYHTVGDVCQMTMGDPKLLGIELPSRRQEGDISNDSSLPRDALAIRGISKMECSYTKSDVCHKRTEYLPKVQRPATCYDNRQISKKDRKYLSVGKKFATTSQQLSKDSSTDAKILPSVQTYLANSNFNQCSNSSATQSSEDIHKRPQNEQKDTHNKGLPKVRKYTRKVSCVETKRSSSFSKTGTSGNLELNKKILEREGVCKECCGNTTCKAKIHKSLTTPDIHTETKKPKEKDSTKTEDSQKPKVESSSLPKLTFPSPNTTQTLNTGAKSFTSSVDFMKERGSNSKHTPKIRSTVVTRRMSGTLGKCPPPVQCSGAVLNTRQEVIPKSSSFSRIQLNLVKKETLTKHSSQLVLAQRRNVTREKNKSNNRKSIRCDSFKKKPSKKLFLSWKEYVHIYPNNVVVSLKDSSGYDKNCTTAKHNSENRSCKDPPPPIQAASGKDSNSKMSNVNNCRIVASRSEGKKSAHKSGENVDSCKKIAKKDVINREQLSCQEVASKASEISKKENLGKYYNHILTKLANVNSEPSKQKLRFLENENKNKERRQNKVNSCKNSERKTLTIVYKMSKDKKNY